MSLVLDSVSQLVPSGHEESLRQAFYTAAAILFTVAGCTAAVYVYYVLEIFIKPLMWALLCGSFLFPFKYSLHSTLESWLKENEESGRPLIVGAVLIPISIFDKFAEAIGKFILNKWKVLVAITMIISVFYFLHLIQLLYIFQPTFLGLWNILLFVWNSISVSVEFFAQYRIAIITAVVAYTIAALTVEQRSVTWIRYGAVPAWISLLICIVSVAGSLQVPLGIGLLILVINGAVTALKQKFKQGDIRRTILEGRKSITALWQSTSTEVAENLQGEDDVTDGDNSTITKDEDNAKCHSTKGKFPQSEDGVTDIHCAEKPPKSTHPRRSAMKSRPSESAIYFNFLFFAFFLMMAWIHTWVFVLLIIPLFYWCLKQLCCLELVVNFFASRCQLWLGVDLHTAKVKMIEYYKVRKTLLFPPSVRSVVDIILKGDRKFNTAVLEALPTITSTIMILILIVGSISISLFFAVKVQQESFLLVQLTSDLVNETVSKHPEYKSWLPDNETMHKSMDSIVDKVYWQGREWIKEQLQNNLGNEGNVTLIEKQALKIWDRAYHSWFNKSVVKGKKLLHRQSTESILHSHEGGSGLFSGVVDLINMSEVIAMLKENMSALMSVMESVWSIVQTNVSLIFSSVTTVLTVLLYGGTAVLNFVLSTVVFFTSLFYLLAASQQRYMPIQLIRIGTNSSAKPSPIATSIQDAISGVFGASLKMASFYGLYTWLNHTALGSALVYIPSLLAAIFSVVPVLSTYWACIPAFLELWLLRGDLFRGLALLLFQFLPTLFVDGAIYSEMAASGGGHPYITGLAVVGGLYYFGLEGAIIGPIVLCILLVALNVYFRIINMPATDAAVQPRVGQQGLRTPVVNFRNDADDTATSRRLTLN